MYHSTDPYGQIMEDIGNLRGLTDQQLAYLCEMDKLSIMAVVVAMVKSQEMLLGVLPETKLSLVRSESNLFIDMLNQTIDGMRHGGGGGGSRPGSIKKGIRRAVESFGSLLLLESLAALDSGSGSTSSGSSSDSLG
jgi:hypothetical protein